MSVWRSIPIPHPVEVALTPIRNLERHLDWSPRSVLVSYPEPVEIGTIVKVSLKVLSMTGSMDFQGKVISCKADGSGLYDLQIHFYGMSHEQENEILEFIQNAS